MGVGRSARPRTVGTAPPFFVFFDFPVYFLDFFLRFIQNPLAPPWDPHGALEKKGIPFLGPFKNTLVLFAPRST